ncbi:MAG: ATP-binding protein [Caldilineaceae bacterium]|nr:ATP-binding protein [Caldilineaceae bacterium]MBP8107067.1 ATP-binding protein [Caldilineaceae bacterium]MBP8121105.1 ATP-binding protein [Caldilineaceae bacterium]MBP9070778.1 ATP-binding protein [Caldilineaceae bacterium]
MTQNAVFQLDLPADLRYLPVVGACLGAILERAEGIADPTELRYNVELAVQETCTNIVEHAYEGRHDGRIAVQITLSHTPHCLIVDVRDTGKSFNPDLVAEPDLDTVQFRGYGLFLMKELMDQVNYQAGPVDNHWHLVKNL